MPAPTLLTLLTRPGCHLCDDARDAVAEVLAGLPDGSVTFLEKSIVDDPELLALHADDIPVVLVDGEVHAVWRVDPSRLRAALA